jgi:hypothetical protein
MIRLASLSLGLIVGLGLSGAMAAEKETQGMLRVTLDQAKVAQVPSGTATLVVGNPSIADVTMLKGGTGMVVTGRGFGQTNLIAIDAQGAILDEKQIRVEPAHTVLVVQRGNSRSSYSCHPWCLPEPQLGDDTAVFSEAAAQISTRNALAKGEGGGGK